MRLSHWLVAGMSVCLGTSTLSAADGYPIDTPGLHNVKLTDGFWADRVATNRKATVWHDFEMCERTGRIENFVNAAKGEGEYHGRWYNDSDVFKVMEGAAYVLAHEKAPKLRQYLDDLIDKVAAAQEPDGYLYTPRPLGAHIDRIGEERWAKLESSHELYNAGHMYEAAVAHYHATGSRKFLEIALKNADLVCETFGHGEDQIQEVPGHQEIEVGLLKLYQVTGDEKYLEQAEFFVDLRGRAEQRGGVGAVYRQNHKPFVAQRDVAGHAVRGLYLYMAGTDLAAMTDDPAYDDTVDALWRDYVSSKMYVTGGVGPRGHGEGFGEPYELPNLRSYAETCASIAATMWNHRLFRLHGAARYMDLVERTFYNAALAGVSLDGDRFFYPNPMKADGQFAFNHGSHKRKPWFGTACCPTNVVRAVPQIRDYIYARQADRVYVNLFVNSRARLEMDSGPVTLEQESQYPWKGTIQLSVSPESARSFPLYVRIPGWARGETAPSNLYRYRDASPVDWSLMVNGEPARMTLEDGYAVVNREWEPGDQVTVKLPMPVRMVQAHDNVESTRGKLAVERGPLVYCVEEADNPDGVLHRTLTPDASFTARHQPDKLGGVTTLQTKAQRVARRDGELAVVGSSQLTFIPYYAWNNRGANPMRVWLPTDKQQLDMPAMKPIDAKTSASHVHGGDTLRAMRDGDVPEGSGDHGIARMTWWPKKGSTEWVQYEFDEARSVSAASVYWFDDTGQGGCRVPASWRLLYRDGDQWRPVPNASAYPVSEDRFNTVTFEPIKTKALRIEAQLKDNFSGGILEWRLEAVNQPATN